MAENPFTAGSGAELFATWMKNATDLWSSAAGGWLKSATDPGKTGRMAENINATVRLMQSLLGTSPDLKAWENASKLMPDLSMQLYQRAIEGFGDWSKRWTQRIETLSQKGPSKPYDFDDFDRDFISRWSDIYEEEFRRFFRIPQLGLGRFYQEKAQELTDAYNIFQTALMEFLNLLSLPVEKAARVMQNQLAELAEKGQMPKETKAIYNMWVKVLEGHFMTLFKSPDYTAVMAKTLDATNNFVCARQRVTEDLLRMIPAPTMRDLDELAEEVHVLKKRVRELEQELKRQAADAE